MEVTQERYSLPNGLIVANTNTVQIQALYTEIFEKEIYLQHDITINENACVLDIGANIGFFTLFAHYKRPDAQIYAFEPIAKTFEILRANITLNNIPARAFQAGLAHYAGEDTFTSFALFNSNSTRLPDLDVTRAIMKNRVMENLTEEKRATTSIEDIDKFVESYFMKHSVETCKVQTLSSVISQHALERIDLLKIDAEKSEYDILTGIAEDDWPRIQQIVMEVHGDDLLEKILPLLRKQGYSSFLGEKKPLPGTAESGNPVYLSMVYAHR